MSKLPSMPLLGLSDDRQRTWGSGDVSLAIFITSLSCSKILASFTSAGLQALGWRLMRPKGMEDLAAFSVREVKRVAAAEEREKRERD